MAGLSKYLSLCLAVILALCSLIMVESASGQTIPKPSVPEFTVKFVDYSYDVPPTYGIDQYTGENIAIQAGYHVDNRTFVVTIRNQGISTTVDSNNNVFGLLYNFRCKGTYGSTWNYYPFHSTYPGDPSSAIYSTNLYGQYTGGIPFSHIYPSSSYDLTTVSLSFADLQLQDAPADSPIDFQVQALNGNASIVHTGLLAGNYYTFTGQTSDWSPTQTLTISANNSSPTSSPTVTPAPTDSLPNMSPTSSPNPNSDLTLALTWIIVGILVISVISLLLYVRHLKRSKSKNYFWSLWL